MDELYKEIVSFQHRCSDYIDDPSSGAARSLIQEAQRLEDDTQVRKDPRSIEGRVQSVIGKLENASEHGAMRPDHAEELIDQCEDFRRKLQGLR